jgi:hypothetical protein
MRLTTFRGEADLSELAARLFEFRGRGATARRRRVEAALLRANPQLADLSRVPQGAVLIVPDVPDVTPRRAGEEAGPAEALAEELVRALSLARARLIVAAQERVAEAERAVSVLDSEELRRARLGVPALDAHVTGVVENVRRRVEDARVERSALEARLERLDGMLGDFQEMLARRLS